MIVLGEAKRDNTMLEKLRVDCIRRFGPTAPGSETKKRGDEAWQLASRLWTVAPSYTWLIGPGRQEAYRTLLNPLRLVREPRLPSARELDLDHEPPSPLTPPALS